MLHAILHQTPLELYEILKDKCSIWDENEVQHQVTSVLPCMSIKSITSCCLLIESCVGEICFTVKKCNVD